jgi:hypothetical protein
MRRFSLAGATKLVRIFVGAFVAATCLLTVHQPANAIGCLEGAMLGGIAGHMKHHTFLGIFGGVRGWNICPPFIFEVEKSASKRDYE